MGSGRGSSRRAQAVGVEGPVLTICGKFHFYEGSVYLSEETRDWSGGRSARRSLRELLYGASFLNREISITVENAGGVLDSASGRLLEGADGMYLYVGDRPVTDLFHGIGGERVELRALLLSEARRIAAGEDVAAERVSF